MRFLTGFGWGIGLGIVAVVGVLLVTFATGQSIEVPFLVSGVSSEAGRPGADVQFEPLGLLGFGVFGGLIGLMGARHRETAAP